MNIFVGNLDFNVTEDELKDLFGEKGEVASVRIIKDRFTGNSRGFGFVEMANEEQGQDAIDSLNGIDFKGRSLKVNKANGPDRERRGGGGDRGDRGGRPRSGGGGGFRGNRDRY
jgi:cold-inducible RNA-binding protein